MHKGQELNRDELVTNVLGSVKGILPIPTKVYALPEAALLPAPPFLSVHGIRELFLSLCP